jgi:hypothetical protein
MVGPDGTEVSPDAVAKVAAAGPISPANLVSAAAAVQDVDALLAKFKTKAQLQAVLAKVNPSANLARTRANLAKDAVSHPNWPNYRREFFPYAKPVVESAHDRNDAGAVITSAKLDSIDENGAPSFSSVVTNAPGPVPPDPEPQYVEHDSSVTEAEAAYISANPYAQPAPVEPLEDQLLRKIGDAQSIADIAALWNEANDAGIGWPARLHQAAEIKTRTFDN